MRGEPAATGERGGHRPDGRGAERERGSALPLVIALLGLCVAAMVVVVEVGRLAVDRAQAQAAADMAALAGLFEGERGAGVVARANGGELLGYTERGEEVRVVVVVGQSRASAVARYEWNDGT